MPAEGVEEWPRDWKQQGIKEGRKEGREEGREEGRKEGEEAVLLRLVEMRFGAGAVETHRARIEQADAEILLRWSEPSGFWRQNARRTSSPDGRPDGWPRAGVLGTVAFPGVSGIKGAACCQQL